MNNRQEPIILEPIQWYQYDQEWLGTTSYMVYTVNVVDGKWVLEAAGCKEIYDNKDALVKRVLQDHASHTKQALHLPYSAKERIGNML